MKTENALITKKLYYIAVILVVFNQIGWATSFVSLIPTSIKIEVLPGSGTHRIIVINTENNFVDPINEQEFIANSVYNTVFPITGQQVIYNGSGTEVTVTVPNATNVYWVRYYDYNIVGGKPIYIITTDANNPKKCELETIALNSPVYRLVRANLGATITSPKKSNINERGIYWSVNPNVSIINGSKLSDAVDADGIYNFDCLVTRGSTIYFKGYVKNETGIIWTTESSFSNVPLFSGSGNWESPERWNVTEVPGGNGDVTYGSINDNPIINGVCTITADNTVNDLTVNATSQLIISKAVQMKVLGTLANNAGTAGIRVKSIDDIFDNAANGSLIFANGSVQATVEMFSKASWNLSNLEGSKFSWQYFGIPVSTLAYSSTFSNCYVREWDESITDYANVWVRRNNNESLQLNSSSSLTSGIGYELVQQYNHKYSFAGTLVNSDYAKSLPYSTGARFAGQSILSNPYTAAMDITQLQFGVNTEAAIFLYNTGTFNEWANLNGENANGTFPGTYTVSTPGSVGLPGVPTHIPSMQGFLVKATAIQGSISFNYSNLIKNTDKQRIKSTVQKTGIMIDLIGNKFADRMWILDDINCSSNFDNGYDGHKILGLNEVSQIFGLGDQEKYQILAVKDMNEAYIGLQPGSDSNFKLRFTNQNIENKYARLYLVDLIENKTIDITTSGTEYNFTANSTDAVQRFKIVSGTTINNKNILENKLIVYNANNQTIVENNSPDEAEICIYDGLGRKISTFKVNSKTSTTLSALIPNGMYILKSTTNNQTITKSIILN